MHVIRLRRPWTKTLGDGGPVFRVDVPEQTDSALEESAAVVHYHRRFNRPSRLQDARVSLRITGWHGRLTSLSLNEMPIHVSESSAGIDVEVSQLLQAHNQLLITLSGTRQSPPRLSGEVTLGIEERPVN